MDCVFLPFWSPSAHVMPNYLSISRAVRDGAVEALRLPREEGVGLVRDEAAVVGLVVGHVGLSVGVQEEVAQYDVVCVGGGLKQVQRSPLTVTPRL